MFGQTTSQQTGSLGGFREGSDNSNNLEPRWVVLCPRSSRHHVGGIRALLRMTSFADPLLDFPRFSVRHSLPGPPKPAIRGIHFSITRRNPPFICPVLEWSAWPQQDATPSLSEPQRHLLDRLFSRNGTAFGGVLQDIPRLRRPDFENPAYVRVSSRFRLW
ncbi:hypothetical protein K491DRAFT_471877 [Lophiostoma macrostomum CBS 122681]|uniref:Uncharacterized protein n=1 Tax=Lophiostoma macrostomum CBS 122681 TaxID=1314788 RepID=A0A6A6T335_9PLEO|nr:hypothetical protein K491DRAFT_471877 [Lophiostoma macrostomum CBS 122681]